MFNGAAYIYENYARKYVKKFGNYGGSNYPEEYKKILHMMTFDARKAVERYIDRFGPDSFERVIRAVCYKQLYFLIIIIIYLIYTIYFIIIICHTLYCRLRKKQRSIE
jgi:hypothetical protein